MGHEVNLKYLVFYFYFCKLGNMAAGSHTWPHCKYLELSASLQRRSHGEVDYLFTMDLWRRWRSFHGSHHCASLRHLKKFVLVHALTLLIFALLITSVKCEDVDEELKLKYPNLHRRGLLPRIFGNKQSRRLPPNPAGGVKIEDGGPHPPGKIEQNNRRPVMPPEQHKVRYDVNPWQDSQKFNYKWPENQRAYFTCPRGYFIASLEPKFGTVQSSILRVPWNNKATLFTLKDKYERGLSPSPAHMKYPRMNSPKVSAEDAQQKQFRRIAEGQSEVSETGCDPVLHCLGHQACLFKISVELCAADPVPGSRKMFAIGVTCVKDSMEGDYISDSKDFVVARKERDHTLYLAYDGSESTPSHAYIVFHQIPEDEIFGVDCPPVNQALQSGYGGWCTLPAPTQTDIADQLWNILGRVPFPECRQELKDVYCAYHYNTTGGCLPPTFIEPRKEGEVPKLGEVNFSFNALPKRGPRPDMTKHKAMLADKHIGLIPVKLGFLILAHANAEAVAQLLEGVYRKQHFYVVHVDYRADSVRDHLVERAEELRGDLDNIHVLPKSRSFIASWGSYDIVRAEIEGYEELLRMGVWEFLINLSGADLPLRDVDDISAMLAAYRGYNFMRQNGNWNDRSGKATDYTVWYGCGGHVYNISKRGQRPSWSDMHSASQWAVLNRDYLDYVLNPAKRDEKLNNLQFYAMTCIIPDESFLISMMKISPFRNTFIHSNMHHLKAFARRDDKGFCRHTDDIDFCGQGPGTIVAADANNLHLMAHNFFFSRKYTGDPEEKARLEALKLANGAHYEDLYREFIKPSMLRQLVEMVMEEQYGENWMNEAEVQDILKVRVFPQPVTLDPCCLPIYTTKNQLSRDVKYWIDFSLYERATSSVRVLRGSFIPQSRTNCFSRGHLKALYISSHVTNDRKVPVKQVNILPHEIAGGKQIQMVSYVNVNENIAKAQGCNEIENLPDDSFDHRSPDSFTYVRYPQGVNNPSIHFNASLINDIGEVKCFLEVVVTFKKPHPTVQQSDTVRFINTINCGPLTPGFWTIVLFQKGVKDPFPYTTQIYFAEDNGASDWDEYSLNDALFGLWLIEDVRPLSDEDYPGVAKQPRPVYHDPDSENSANNKAHALPRKRPPQKEAAKKEETESSDASSVNEESDKDTKNKEKKPGGGVKNNPPNNVLFQNDNSQVDSKPIIPGRNLNTPPNNRKRIKLRESLQRGLVDPLRLSENNRDDIGKRHAMGHQEGSNLGLVGDKTRAHFKGWRHQSFGVILLEFLLISTVLFIFTRLVLVPMRLVKRRSSGFRSYLTFLVSFTLLQVVLFSVFTLYSS